MQSALPVLMYHHVCPKPGLVTVSPENFEAQMEALVRTGWHTVGSAQLEAFFSGRSLPKKSVVITFDDGYLDNFIYAHPILERLGQKALCFVVTSWPSHGPVRQSTQRCFSHSECKHEIATGNSDNVIMRWSEMRLMKDKGTFEFHSHTHTHSRWDQMLPNTEARLVEMREELKRSRKILFDQLEVQSPHLCWPQGYFQPEYVPLAAQLGYRWIHTTEARTNRKADDGLHIGRIVVKDKPGSWLVSRLRIYSSCWQSNLYALFKSLKPW